MKNDMTRGSIVSILFRFAIPFFIASFLQTFYGVADLFIVGQYNGPEVISAVAIGSQLMHMLTVMIVALAMGATVGISRAIGAGEKKEAAKTIGNTTLLFLGFSVIMALLLLLFTNAIVAALSTPEEARLLTATYMRVCFVGLIFIVAYNVISSIFRGLGDSRSPMIFVAVSVILNIFLDYLFVGPLGMKAFGAAIATVISQAVSVGLALGFLFRMDLGLPFEKCYFTRFDRAAIANILKVGFPMCAQDGFIQISFLVITAIANRRGVNISASVGIVEKCISFLFLVPSAMSSTTSAVAAQNLGAGLKERARQVLYYAIAISIAYSALIVLICEILPSVIVGLFTEDGEVVRLGAQYLRTYILDILFVSFHFNYSGYFGAWQKAMYSFIPNLLAIILFRIPVAYLASVLYPASLYAMGLGAPIGSAFTALVMGILAAKLHRTCLKS